MDPNATLKEIRELVAANDTASLDEGDTDHLTDLIAALDAWLSKGGALPGGWLF